MDPLLTSTNAAAGQALAVWNTRSLKDGTYSVRMTALGNSSQRAINSFSINNSPPPPTNLVAVDTPFDGGGSLTLSWQVSGDDGAGNNDVAGYNIYKSTFSGGFVYLAHVLKGVTTYIDNACPVYTTFYYTVTALDAVSESDFSNVAWAFSLADGVLITPANGGVVTITVNGLTTEADFPPGAVASNVWAGILIPASYSNTGVPASAKSTSQVRIFGVNPSTTKFLKPVIIKMPYYPSEHSQYEQNKPENLLVGRKQECLERPQHVRSKQRERARVGKP